jgi:hypothetical protein
MTYSCGTFDIPVPAITKFIERQISYRVGSFSRSVKFSGRLCPLADTSDQHISPAGIAESVLAKTFKILTNQVKHIKP